MSDEADNKQITETVKAKKETEKVKKTKTPK